MRRAHKLIAMLLFFVTGFVFICSTKIISCLVPKTVIGCAELGLTNLDPATGEARCERRNFILGTYAAITLKKFHGPNPLRFQFIRNEHNSTITGQIIKAPPGTMKVTTANGKTLWQSSGVGTEWSGATRSLVASGADREIFIWTSDSEYEYEIILVNHFYPTLQSNLLAGLSVFIILSLAILLLPRNHYSALTHTSILISSLALLILWCGLPYGSAAGWFDPGDDASYFHWTYNLGYLFDPHLTHGGLKSWAADHNHHSWGTGLMLAPFLIPARIIAPNLGPGSLHFGLMNFGVMMWGCVAVFVTFRAFSLLTGWRSALVMALFTLVSTSALKWMFMRNFFSHVPELFAAACVSYYGIQRYLKRRYSTGYFIGMLFALWLATQIRRENIALFAVPFLYEWLINSNRDRKKILRDSGIILFIAMVSVISLLATNYFTKLGAFFASSQTHSDFHINKFWTMLYQHGAEVLWRESYGLFYWKNAFSWLALAAIFLHRRTWRLWGPLCLITAIYLLMCMLYEYPNGMEWQNRFLLKLNPILFGGALIFLRDTIKPLKVAGWIWMISGAAMELDLYRKQLPTGMNFYINDFVDHGLQFPQGWPGIKMAIFYLPLIFISFLSSILWLRVYWMTRNAQSLGDS